MSSEVHLVEDVVAVALLEVAAPERERDRLVEGRGIIRDRAERVGQIGILKGLGSETLTPTTSRYADLSLSTWRWQCTAEYRCSGDLISLRCQAIVQP